MADNSSVVADAAGIKNLGDDILSWALRVDELKVLLDNAFVTPGHVEPYADDVRNRFNVRVKTELSRALDQVHGSFSGIGLELKRIAQVYATAEDLNKDDLLRLQKLIRSVNKIYPEFSPIPAPTTPPPY
ncbi:hypothetical protein [Micromonospora echinofusca]|uniref:Uncharacterized protein n=1 Tax=Micromonospora echinofusca TaxID=47858 RepID=A0ABS3VX73_MICEH|nr:hypothetical protein [Micromonospora echinofusca]MBO4209023.1 hypothetical protein [Micromonospora echinofusca]